MVRSIRDLQYEQTKEMSDEKKIEYYHERAKALMMQLEQLVEKRRQKMVTA